MPKVVSYTTNNTYDTLNTLSPTTKNVWLVCHGIGYLSRYFINLFKDLPASENYIIAPQAPSKYYKDSRYKHVGACWLTKENTALDTENVLQYLDAVMANESYAEHLTFNILGYSQGVSIVSRWVATRRIHCDNLLLISGGFPKELQPSDFSFLTSRTKVTQIIGKNDPYIKDEYVTGELRRLKCIFQNIDIRYHNGGHELKTNSFRDLF